MAADTRLGYPSGPGEMNFGDGAAALLVSASGTVAEVTSFDTRYYEIQDTGARTGTPSSASAEDRFSMDEGYADVIAASVSAVLAKHGLAAADVPHFALNSPNGRQLAAFAKKMRLDDKAQIADVMHRGVGDTGCAMALMSLVAVLERAKSGEKILLASYGNGCDVVLLEATATHRPASRRGIKGHLASKRMLANYNQYLRWRELVEVQPPARPPLEIPHAVAGRPVARGALGDAAHRHQVHAVRHAAVSAAAGVRDLPHQGRDGAVQLPGRAGQGVLLLARLGHADARPAGDGGLRGLRGRRPHHVRHDRPGPGGRRRWACPWR